MKPIPIKYYESLMKLKDNVEKFYLSRIVMRMELSENALYKMANGLKEYLLISIGLA